MNVVMNITYYHKVTPGRVFIPVAEYTEGDNQIVRDVEGRTIPSEELLQNYTPTPPFRPGIVRGRMYRNIYTGQVRIVESVSRSYVYWGGPGRVSREGFYEKYVELKTAHGQTINYGDVFVGHDVYSSNRYVINRWGKAWLDNNENPDIHLADAAGSPDNGFDAIVVCGYRIKNISGVEQEEVPPPPPEPKYKYGDVLRLSNGVFAMVDESRMHCFPSGFRTTTEEFKELVDDAANLHMIYRIAIPDGVEVVGNVMSKD